MASGQEPAGGGALRVGLGGFGAIGREVARRLDKGVEGLRLVAVSARRRQRALERVAGLETPVEVVELGALAEVCDVVVECCPAAVFRQVAEPALRAGRTLVALSVGALLEHQDLVDLAGAAGGRIVVPTGALIGLDAVRAAAEGDIRSLSMVTRKPPGSFAGAPFIEQNGIDLDRLTAPLKIFEGNVRQAVRGFPANVNVAVALGLAGIGADATRIEIWADPALTRNTHTIEVEADSARFEMHIENVPSEENPRTGRIVALSVIAPLRALASPLRIGT